MNEGKRFDDEVAGSLVGGPLCAGDAGGILHLFGRDFLGNCDVRMEVERTAEFERAGIQQAMQFPNLRLAEFQADKDDIRDRKDLDIAENDLERFNVTGFFLHVFDGFADLAGKRTGRQDGNMSVRTATGIEI